MRIVSVEAFPKAGIFKFLAPRAFSPKDSSSQRSPKSKQRRHITTELNLWTWTLRGWESLVLISLTSLPPTSRYPFPSYYIIRKMFVWDKQILSQWKNYHTTKNEWTGSFFSSVSPFVFPNISIMHHILSGLGKILMILTRGTSGIAKTFVDLYGD